MRTCTLTAVHILHAFVGSRPRFGKGPQDVFAADIAATRLQPYSTIVQSDANTVGKIFGPPIDGGAQESGPQMLRRLQEGCIVRNTLRRSLVDG